MDSIELSDFITKTLVDIAKGISDANQSLKDRTKRGDNYFVLRSNRGDSEEIQGITFDIAINASQTQKDKAGFMVALATIGGGANTVKGVAGETAHRIKFEVGIYWDVQ